MIYNEFLSLLERGKKGDSFCNTFDSEAYSDYLDRVNTYLDSYFTSKASNMSTYDLLRRRAQGSTLDEIGKTYHLTRERIRQKLAKALEKLRDPYVIEGNKDLKGLFSFLVGIGEGEIMTFLFYLFPKKHVLLLIISDELYKQSFQFEKFLKGTTKKVRKPKTKSKSPRASDESCVKGIKEFIQRTPNCPYSFSTIADILVEDYHDKNTYGFDGRVTWNRIMTVLYDMELEGVINRVDRGTVIVVKK